MARILKILPVSCSTISLFSPNIWQIFWSKMKEKLPDFPLFLKTVEDTNSIEVTTIFARKKGKKFLSNESHLD